MPKTVISFNFTVAVNPYLSDLEKLLSINSRFVPPPDLDAVGINAIVIAAGGIITNEPVVCSDSSLGSPRKLQFIRSSGNSMSIAIADKTNLIAAANTIKGILDALNGGSNPVVCIKLIGEKFNNLNDELGVAYDGTVFAPSHKAPATATKQNYASGIIAYEADAASIIGTVVTTGIRSITESADNVFAAQLGTTPEDCGIEFLNIQNCGNGRRNPRRHRRLKLSFATKADPADAAEASQTEDIELPVYDASTANALTCADAAAGLPGIYCIGWEGESYSRFHNFL